MVQLVVPSSFKMDDFYVLFYVNTLPSIYVITQMKHCKLYDVDILYKGIG
jgi:hypothetical protein